MNRASFYSEENKLSCRKINRLLLAQAGSHLPQLRFLATCCKHLWQSLEINHIWKISLENKQVCEVFYIVVCSTGFIFSFSQPTWRYFFWVMPRTLKVLKYKKLMVDVNVFKTSLRWNSKASTFDWSDIKYKYLWKRGNLLGWKS